MLYLCIPTHNEAPTVGLLLWRTRKVFQSYAREYEIIVFDDGSSDGTAEILASYREVLPLTVLGSERHVGYARALASCFRTASERSRYPRRDAVVVMQADFTDAPDHLPELVRRFEGGADVVTAERTTVPEMPRAVKQLRRVGHWLIGSKTANLGTSDPLSGFRLYRLAIVRELLKRAQDSDLLTADGPSLTWSCSSRRPALRADWRVLQSRRAMGYAREIRVCAQRARRWRCFGYVDA
jgi:glycosyltransferase involved in cell wall biosynthesis